MNDEHDDTDGIDLEECLRILCIEQLCQWDVLVFLHRHHSSLVGAEQIAQFLGYTAGAVTDALGRLDHLGLVRRSRASQGVRMYESLRPQDSPRDQLFDHLLGLADHRDGRLQLIDVLRRDERRPRVTPARPVVGGGRPWPRLS